MLLASALAVPAFSTTVNFHASISNADSVPSNSSPAWGVANMVVDTQTREFKIVINLKNVDETLTNSHIHVGLPGANGPVIIPFGGEANYRRAAGKNLHAEFRGWVPADQLEALLTNGTYVNFHTATYPAGAVRGQLIADDVSLWAMLDGWQEVPPHDSPSTGYAAITFNPGTKAISVHVEIDDFPNPVVNSHIHTAPVGVAGPVTLGFGGEAVYIRVGDDLTGEFLNLVWPGTSTVMLNGGTYVNVHSAQYPGGEIRGQIYGN